MRKKIRWWNLTSDSRPEGSEWQKIKGTPPGKKIFFKFEARGQLATATWKSRRLVGRWNKFFDERLALINSGTRRGTKHPTASGSPQLFERPAEKTISIAPIGVVNFFVLFFVPRFGCFLFRIHTLLVKKVAARMYAAPTQLSRLIQRRDCKVLVSRWSTAGRWATRLCRAKPPDYLTLYAHMCIRKPPR